MKCPWLLKFYVQYWSGIIIKLWCIIRVFSKVLLLKDNFCLLINVKCSGLNWTQYSIWNETPFTVLTPWSYQDTVFILFNFDVKKKQFKLVKLWNNKLLLLAFQYIAARSEIKLIVKSPGIFNSCNVDSSSACCVKLHEISSCWVVGVNLFVKVLHLCSLLRW